MANGNVTTTTALVGLSGQLDTVRTEIAATNVGLQNVASLIQTDSFLDQQRLLQEREQERLLAEREVRVGQEQELQRKVTAAVTQPVVRLEQKLTSTFDGITNALRFLFTGVLGSGLLNGLRVASSASLKALTGISGLIKNSFNAIGSGFSALRGGFGSVIRSITGVTSRISKAILSLAASPFKAIADIFKKFVPGVKPSGGGGGGIGPFSLLTSAGGAFGLAENLKEGDIPGMALNIAQIIPSPVQFPAAIAGFGYEAFGGKNIDIKKTFGEMGQSFSNFLGINIDAPAKEVKGNVEEGKPTQSPAPKPGPVPIQTVPFTPPATSQKPNLNALPEPKPDVIYASTGQQSQPSVVSGQTETLTDVPLIPSSNPDNFYTLYAQVNYNVVM
jgi:hypothetical protein